MASAEEILAVMECAANYAERASVLDAKGQSENFTEDCEFWGPPASMGLPDEPIKGRDGIVAFFQPTFDGLEYLQQHPHMSSVKINGDTATAHTRFTEFAKLKGGPLLMVMAHNEDELRKVNGRWLFSKRRMILKKLTAITELPMG